MVQNLEDLRGPDLAVLLRIREKSLREATGTGSLSRDLKSRRKTTIFRSFRRAKVPTPDDDQNSSGDEISNGSSPSKEGDLN